MYLTCLWENSILSKCTWTKWVPFVVDLSIRSDTSKMVSGITEFPSSLFHYMLKEFSIFQVPFGGHAILHHRSSFDYSTLSQTKAWSGANWCCPGGSDCFDVQYCIQDTGLITLLDILPMFGIIITLQIRCDNQIIITCLFFRHDLCQKFTYSPWNSLMYLLSYKVGFLFIIYTH